MYQRVSGQVIVAGMGDILGIRFDAISFIFDIYQVYDPDLREELFEKITLIDSIRMKARSEQIINQKNQTNSGRTKSR